MSKTRIYNNEGILEEVTIHRGVRLDGAYFLDDDLSGFDFSDSVLTDCTFEGNVLDGANFEGAVLNDTFLNGASLKNVNFRNSTMRIGTIQNCDLSGSDFTKAKMISLCFSGVSDNDFTGAILDETRLEGVEYGFDVILKANLRSVYLDSVVCEELFGDSRFEEWSKTGNIILNDFASLSVTECMEFCRDSDGFKKTMPEGENPWEDMHGDYMWDGEYFDASGLGEPRENNKEFLKFVESNPNITWGSHPVTDTTDDIYTFNSLAFIG